jgi:hypothetical protein
MKKQVLVIIVVLCILAVPAREQETKRAPVTFPLECAGGDCVLLKGVPQTSGMRGGPVKLKPQESVGWHSTGENEEALTILPDVPVHEKMLVYIPPAMRHNVTNTGKEVLEYVWVVAPVKK